MCLCIVNVWIMMCLYRKCMDHDVFVYRKCMDHDVFVYRKCMDHDVCVSPSSTAKPLY